MAQQEAVVMTDETLATALEGSDDDPIAARVHELVAAAGGSLAPMFPGAPGELRTYFHCFVEPEQLDPVVDELRSQPGVVAVYLKPTDALP